MVVAAREFELKSITFQDNIFKLREEVATCACSQPCVYASRASFLCLKAHAYTVEGLLQPLAQAYACACHSVTDCKACMQGAVLTCNSHVAALGLLAKL